MKARLTVLALALSFVVTSYGASLSAPSISSNVIRFSFQCATNEIVVVQATTSLASAWKSAAEYNGIGGLVTFSAPLTNSATLFRLQVNSMQSAGPVLQFDAITLKAGKPVHLQLAASGGVEPLTWSAEDLPEGVILSPDGLLSGTPTADAAEQNENGRFVARVEVADAASSPRRATSDLDLLVRLSYRLNIQATRPDGPSLKFNCSLCHSADFKPNIHSDATALINVLSGSGAECGTDRPYIAPPDASDSLIYEKVSSRNPCGERMPFGGPYFNQTQINRLARWIRELTPEDAD